MRKNLTMIFIALGALISIGAYAHDPPWQATKNNADNIEIQTPSFQDHAEFIAQAEAVAHSTYVGIMLPGQVAKTIRLNTAVSIIAANAKLRQHPPGANKLFRVDRSRYCSWRHDNILYK